MKDKKNLKWVIFALVFIFTIACQYYLQQRYTSILQGGVEYQWEVRLERTNSWIPKDYLIVDFVHNEAKWNDMEEPIIGQDIFVSLGVEDSGLLFIKQAQHNMPVSGEYIRAKVLEYSQGVVKFEIPFNRVQVDLKKVDPLFYNEYQEPVIATLKIKNGRGIITGIYVKGIPLELAVPVMTAAETTKEENADKEVEKAILRSKSNTVIAHKGKE